MKANDSKCFKRPSGGKYFLLLFKISLLVAIGLPESMTEGSETNTELIDFGAFQQAFSDQDDVKAVSIGETIFADIAQEYEGDAGFRAFKSKLDAAKFLSGQMQQQLRKATNTQMIEIVDEVFEKGSKKPQQRPLSVAPAKRFYETSLRLFSRPVKIESLKDEEKSFLAQFYNLKLRVLTSEIAKAGQALAIANPAFKGTHDYVLVLPLLHVSERRPINIDVLPKWMRQPSQLDVFANSCLLHFGLPFHAMTLAGESAKIRNSSFSKLEFYRSAAEKCGTTYAHIAADCLRRAIADAKEKTPEMTIKLQFEVVQLWLDSRNYSLAASEAQKIAETYPDHEDRGRAIWLHYYALSRANSIDEILADIDEALDDKRCELYKPKLMYIKWWSLRRKRDQIARVAALEFELLEQYSNDPMVAPIMLSRATDMLASQNYSAAYEALAQLVEKFPSTKAATQAKGMLTKLKAIEGIE
ncbi:MAG: tetratricopeptide repeat protein [Planctomycetota bacterium]|jgi:outer membrane protein assembly factor BamD (BamD/ComL family)